MFVLSDDKKLAIEEMAAVIAHEVKNPLTLVSVNIDILEQTDTRHLDKNYALIRKELKKINDIMQDFIHLTQKKPVDYDIVYVIDILKDICADIELSAPDVNIKLDYHNKDFCIYGNENSFKILVRNITKNALEAMEYEGELIICVTSHDGCLIISFQDTGKGFADDISKKIFDDYFTTKQSGSGLGLSICKKIAAEYGANFTLENNKTKGCTATITIPAALNL